jgi:hypothetical protein
MSPMAIREGLLSIPSGREKRVPCWSVSKDTCVPTFGGMLRTSNSSPSPPYLQTISQAWDFCCFLQGAPFHLHNNPGRQELILSSD